MTDRYTKAVLTVIAASLSVIAAENLKPVKDAHAQSYGPAHVIVDSFSSTAFSLVEPVQVRVAQGY